MFGKNWDTLSDNLEEEAKNEFTAVHSQFVAWSKTALNKLSKEQLLAAQAIINDSKHDVDRLKGAKQYESASKRIADAIKQITDLKENLVAPESVELQAASAYIGEIKKQTKKEDAPSKEQAPAPTQTPPEVASTPATPTEVTSQEAPEAGNEDDEPPETEEPQEAETEKAGTSEKEDNDETNEAESSSSEEEDGEASTKEDDTEGEDTPSTEGETASTLSPKELEAKREKESLKKFFDSIGDKSFFEEVDLEIDGLAKATTAVKKEGNDTRIVSISYALKKESKGDDKKKKEKTKAWATLELEVYLNDIDGRIEISPTSSGNVEYFASTEYPVTDTDQVYDMIDAWIEVISEAPKKEKGTGDTDDAGEVEPKDATDEGEPSEDDPTKTKDEPVKKGTEDTDGAGEVEPKERQLEEEDMKSLKDAFQGQDTLVLDEHTTDLTLGGHWNRALLSSKGKNPNVFRGTIRLFKEEKHKKPAHSIDIVIKQGAEGTLEITLHHKPHTGKKMDKRTSEFVSNADLSTAIETMIQDLGPEIEPTVELVEELQQFQKAFKESDILHIDGTSYDLNADDLWDKVLFKNSSTDPNTLVAKVGLFSESEPFDPEHMLVISISPSAEGKFDIVLQHETSEGDTLEDQPMKDVTVDTFGKELVRIVSSMEPHEKNHDTAELNETLHSFEDAFRGRDKIDLDGLEIDLTGVGFWDEVVLSSEHETADTLVAALEFFMPEDGDTDPTQTFEISISPAGKDTFDFDFHHIPKDGDPMTVGPYSGITTREFTTKLAELLHTISTVVEPGDGTETKDTSVETNERLRPLEDAFKEKNSLTLGSHRVNLTPGWNWEKSEFGQTSTSADTFQASIQLFEQYSQDDPNHTVFLNATPNEEGTFDVLMYHEPYDGAREKDKTLTNVTLNELGVAIDKFLVAISPEELPSVEVVDQLKPLQRAYDTTDFVHLDGNMFDFSENGLWDRVEFKNSSTHSDTLHVQAGFFEERLHTKPAHILDIAIKPKGANTFDVVIKHNPLHADKLDDSRLKAVSVLEMNTAIDQFFLTEADKAELKAEKGNSLKEFQKAFRGRDTLTLGGEAIDLTRNKHWDRAMMKHTKHPTGTLDADIRLFKRPRDTKPDHTIEVDITPNGEGTFDFLFEHTPYKGDSIVIPPLGAAPISELRRTIDSIITKLDPEKEPKQTVHEVLQPLQDAFRGKDTLVLAERTIDLTQGGLWKKTVMETRSADPTKLDAKIELYQKKYHNIPAHKLYIETSINDDGTLEIDIRHEKKKGTDEVFETMHDTDISVLAEVLELVVFEHLKEKEKNERDPQLRNIRSAFWDAKRNRILKHGDTEIDLSAWFVDIRTNTDEESGAAILSLGMKNSRHDTDDKHTLQMKLTLNDDSTYKFKVNENGEVNEVGKLISDVYESVSIEDVFIYINEWNDAIGVPDRSQQRTRSDSQARRPRNHDDGAIGASLLSKEMAANFGITEDGDEEVEDLHLLELAPGITLDINKKYMYVDGKGAEADMVDVIPVKIENDVLYLMKAETKDADDGPEYIEIPKTQFEDLADDFGYHFIKI